MKKSKKDTNFEEYYFEGYYKGIGDFSEKRDRELKNWFTGMFNYIDKHYPLKKGENKHLIEFGCATGAASSVLHSFGYNITATDISKYAVKRAKKNYPEIFFSVYDMQKPFSKNNYFDVALAFDVIEHLENPELGIKNVYQMLKKKGVIIFSTPNDYKHICKDPTHINVKKPEEWRKIIKKMGFRDIIIRQVTYVPYFYRLHWRLNYAMPMAVASRYLISPVFIIARK